MRKQIRAIQEAEKLPSLLYHSVDSEKTLEFVQAKGIVKDEQGFVYLSKKPLSGSRFKYVFKVTIPKDKMDNLYDWREFWTDGEGDKEYDPKNPYYIYTGNIPKEWIQLVKS